MDPVKPKEEGEKPARILAYPHHVNRAKKWISRYLEITHLFLEVVDARIVESSTAFETRNRIPPEKRLIVLTRAGLAEPAVTRRWLDHFAQAGVSAVAVDSITREGIQPLRGRIRQWHRDRQAPMTRVMVLGIPNVGKSTLINQLLKRHSAPTGDRVGVTRGPQWLRLDQGLELLDLPGVVDFKVRGEDKINKLLIMRYIFSEQEPDMVVLAEYLFCWAAANGRGDLLRQLELSREGNFSEVLADYCQCKGLLKKGGAPDIDRGASRLILQFRSGGAGPCTMEFPPVGGAG